MHVYLATIMEQQTIRRRAANAICNIICQSYLEPMDPLAKERRNSFHFFARKWYRTGEFLRGTFGQTFFQILCLIWIEGPMICTFAGTENA